MNDKPELLDLLSLLMYADTGFQSKFLKDDLAAAMNGNFSYNVAQHFFSIYSLQKEWEAILTREVIPYFMKLASPASYEVFVDLACIHSQNPLKTALQAYGKAQKRVRCCSSAILSSVRRKKQMAYR